MKILLLSAYDASSHQYWWKGLRAQFPDYEWTVLTLPPRYFQWRIRGNALSWSGEEQETLNKQYDLLVVTSMVDLATLKGLNRNLSALPTVSYFHENQFLYPGSEKSVESLEAKMVTLYNALAADVVVFNSEFNRSTFLGGVQDLVGKLPDHVPFNVTESLRSKSQIVPVPVSDELFVTSGKKSSKFSIVWNHRWEYDKGPERLAAVLERLCLQDIDFEIHIIGQQFRTQPKEFAEIKQRYGHCIASFGFVEAREEYLEILAESHVVLSTALHEFQGISVLEAVSLGAAPVLPDDLVYPEIYGQPYCYDVCENSLADNAVELILSVYSGGLPTLDRSSIEARYSWRFIAPRYRDLFEALSG